MHTKQLDKTKKIENIKLLWKVRDIHAHMKGSEGGK